MTVGYVNCADIGHVVSIHDPAGDEEREVPLIRSERLVPGDDQHADLIEVRVAATSHRFCADFLTREPLISGSWISLDVFKNGVQSNEFSPTINERSSTVPELQSPINNPIAGKLGRSGHWVSLLLTGDSSDTKLPERPFEFRAYSAHEYFIRGRTRLTSDSAPNAPSEATYP